MNLFDVYPLFDINIVKGKGCHVWDENGTEYLDLYGGHAVISIGHAHPHYVEMVSNQVATLEEMKKEVEQEKASVEQEKASVAALMKQRETEQLHQHWGEKLYMLQAHQY